MKISINHQVVEVKESATLAINQQAKALRKEGLDVYHFGFGQSPFPVPEAIQNALKDNTDKKDYLPTQGLPELCEAISGFYQQQFGYSFAPEQVFVGPGSKELLFQLIYLFEGPLLIPAPSWVSYGPQASIRGKEIVPIMTKRANGYRLQAEELDRVCHQWTGSQKILIFNNPSNPTGSCHTLQEIKELAEICRAYNVIVLSDEIYSLVDFSGREYASLAHHYPEGTVVTGGLSKGFSGGGYRMGLALIPEIMTSVVQGLKALISETFSAVSAPIQYAALEAYGKYVGIQSEIERCAQIHQFAGEYLHQRFIQMGLNCPKPEGAFYLFPDFDNFREKLAAKGILTGTQMTQAILEQAHVALLPALDFYLPATHLGVRVASVDYDGQKALEHFPGKGAMMEQETRWLFPNLVRGCDQLEHFLETFI